MSVARCMRLRSKPVRRLQPRVPASFYLASGSSRQRPPLELRPVLAQFSGGGRCEWRSRLRVCGVLRS
eukprot:8740027-Lingulodinium_polyedra.AAC.1